jgi:hypothetical protein
MMVCVVLSFDFNVRGKVWGGGHKDSNRERDRDRETERQRHTHTHTQRERERERAREPLWLFFLSRFSWPVLKIL